MKKLISYIFILISFTSQAQHSLEKIWQTAADIPVPESVLKSKKSQILYVSQIDGDASTADGKGAIGKLNTDGETINLNWVTNLNAPKGMGIYRDKMYVADLTDVVVININNGKIIKKIPVQGSKFLNDITINDKGIVYVSETRLNKVYCLKNDIPEVYLENIKSANGLKAIGTDLYILAGPELLKVDYKKNIIKIAEGFELGGDGIEPIGNGDFLVSCWGEG